MVYSAVIHMGIGFARHLHAHLGTITLREAIGAAGSVSRAARDLGMSYRHARLVVDSLQLALEERVSLATRWGGGNRGVTLTGFGESLVITWLALEHALCALARWPRSIIPIIERIRCEVAVRHHALLVNRKCRAS
jgi:molybdate transport system regulatory protein